MFFFLPACGYCSEILNPLGKGDFVERERKGCFSGILAWDFCGFWVFCFVEIY